MKATATLFGVETRPRPRENDEAFIDAEALRLLLALKDEFKHDDELEWNDDALLDALREGVLSHYDGYEFARYLERTVDFEGSTAVVEILDGASTHEHHTKAVKAWVVEQGLEPRLAVGDHVTVEAYNRQTNATETHDGVIGKIDHREARYVVRIPALGHVVKGVGTHGAYLPYEDVETPENLEWHMATAIVEQLAAPPPQPPPLRPWHKRWWWRW